MKSIPHAMGAFALACLAGAASATVVEVTFDVTVKTKVDYTFSDGVPTTLPDAAFKPVSFTTSIRFDLANPQSQTLYQPVGDAAQAWTWFDPATVSFSPSPFSASLQVPAPANALVDGQSDASYGQYQHGKPQNADHAIPVLKQVSFSRQKNWKASGIDGPGSTTTQLYMRGIIFEVDGGVLSSNQFSKLSGEDALAFLQTQVGVLHGNAYSEVSGHLVYDPKSPFVGPYRESASREYTGDVMMRSVTVVPEPGAWMLSLSGLALIGLHAHGRRRAARARQC